MSASQMLLASARAAGVPAGTVIFDELWTGAAGAAVPAAWTYVTGAPPPVQSGTGFVGWGAGNSGVIVRDAGVSDWHYTGVVSPVANNYDGLILNFNFGDNSLNVLFFHTAVGNKLRYAEGSGTNIYDSDTTYTITDPPTAIYTVEAIKTGTNLVVKVNGTLVTFNGGATSITMIAGLGANGLGVTQAGAGGSATSKFGELKATT